MAGSSQHTTNTHSALNYDVCNELSPNIFAFQ